MDYVKKQHLEDGLHRAEELGAEELRNFEKNILHKELDKVAHQYQGMCHHSQEQVSILRSGFNVKYEHALEAVKDELEELTTLEKEAVDKLCSLDHQGSPGDLDAKKLRDFYEHHDIDHEERPCDVIRHKNSI
ncbi:hypothetical protein HDE_04463 [Halotydeus destructor]|nr:hypothetical protein HDE_04463 [Halotydeus destructor]